MMACFCSGALSPQLTLVFAILEAHGLDIDLVVSEHEDADGSGA